MLVAAGPGASSVHGISVDLFIAEGAYCSQNTGALYASVSGGTGPYTYNWYQQQGSWVPVCMGCGSSLQNLYEFTTYKVVVTDALSATAEATQQVPGLVSAWIQNLTYWPYLQGASPVISYTIYGESVGGGIYHQTDVSPNAGMGGYISGSTHYSAALPVGATTCTVYAWAVQPAAASAAAG